MTRKLSFLLVLSLFVLPQSIAQILPMAAPEDVGMSTERLERIDRVFEDYVTDQHMAGSVILLARKGKVAYFKAFGFADKENDVVMQKDAIFRIASQTKALISVGIMILQEEGRLLIQDPLDKYIPEFEGTTVAQSNGNGGYEVVDATRKITLRDLLTHTAGIGYGYGLASDKWKEAGIQGWYFADRDEPIGATVERMAALPMNAQPGTQWVYGYNTDILGVVIERASGMSLDKFLQEKLLDPLGMKDTHFYLPESKADRLTTVYTPEEGALSRSPQEGTMNSQGAYLKGPRKSFSGGAGLLSTASDYYRFLQMLENEGELDGVRILSPTSVALMTSDHLGDISFNPGAGFGLGFEVITDLGLYGKPGTAGAFGWGGAYGSSYWVDPAKELVVVYFKQVRPSSRVPDQDILRALVYQAIID